MDIANHIRFWDYHTYLFFYSAIHGRPWLSECYLFFAKYGVVLVAASTIYLILRKTIIAFVSSFIAVAIAVLIDAVVVIFWRRPRPFISHSNQIIAPITQGLRVDAISFPSAHTYFAFAIATSIFLYGHRRLGVLLFLLAILVGIGRIGAGLHYPSDVIAGAILGIISGVLANIFVRKMQKNWEI